MVGLGPASLAHADAPDRAGIVTADPTESPQPTRDNGDGGGKHGLWGLLGLLGLLGLMGRKKGQHQGGGTTYGPGTPGYGSTRDGGVNDPRNPG
ncbi:hypothetical protein D5H75_01380 [Bailinhaonella thermotolerans]|uniref:Uncharacterized protein n=2 Tax=Bailinhaonella thermotolerans TaxID=1070861 RepID=A0A3A4BDL8_9ACTN|nr:hypothetical protein D5H75_01380 [Bailinhaonella thermotolerans]